MPRTPNSPDIENHPAPLRVLRLIARLNVGGPAKHVGWLTAGLEKSRFQQTLVTGRVAPDEDDMGPWLQSQGVEYLMLPRLGRAIRPLNDVICLWQVIRLLARIRPHILETHTSKAGFVGRTALLLYRPWARLKGWPLPKAIHTFHGHTFHGYFAPLSAKIFLLLERFLARFATWRIAVLSPGQLEEIQGEFKVGRREQFVILPLGIDLQAFSQAEQGRHAFREELGVTADQMLIGCVGRVAPVKNYGLFLQTAARLKSLRPDLYQGSQFVLIGGGNQHDLEELEHLAAELGVSERFRLLGNRDDPQNFYPGLDLLMLTSLNEGTPMVILEAGACSRPVLATAVGGVPELLGDRLAEQEGFCRHRHGLSAPSGNAEALARGLAWLMDNPEEALKLGASLQETVRQKYSRQRLLQDMASLYQEAIKKS